MSEKQQHKKRYNLKLEFIAHFDQWLALEPPMILFWKWKKWKKNRPSLNEYLKKKKLC